MLISDFRDKITLLQTKVTLDSELNRVEALVPLKEVWAVVEVKNAGVDTTPAGEKWQVKYKITVRRQEVNSEYILYKGKTLRLTTPAYDFDNANNNKYVCFEAVEVVGKKCITAEVS